MNEFDFIKHIRERTAGHGHPSRLLRGIGDDAAVIKSIPGRDLVVAADLLVENIDFQRSTTSARFLGHKALAVSLSDIAAMGAHPRWSLLSLGLPADIWSIEFVDQFYDGVFRLADRYQVKLIGGDTSRTPKEIVVDSVVLGDSVSEQVIPRSGAQPGDLILVTGTLGGAAAGLRLLSRGAKLASGPRDDPDTTAIDGLLLRHLSPEPRVGWGLVVGEERLASAMIDISDGLSSDLNHLCEESNVGALIEAAKLPIDVSVTELCGRRALDPLQLALHGGEDFELLFTVNPANCARLPKKVDGVEVTCVGEIRAREQGIRISEGARIWNLSPGGYEHFSRERETMRVRSGV